MQIRSFVAAAIAAGLATSASADTVRLQFVGVGSGQNVRVNLAGTIINCFAGQLVHRFSNGNGVAAGITGNHITFCTDLTEYVSPGGATYTVAPIANLPQTAGWPSMGSTRAQAVYDLFAAGANQQNQGNADANFAAAFQIALWEIAYDYDGTLGSLNLGAGNIKVTNPNQSAFAGAIAADLSQLFSAVQALNVSQTGLLGLTNNGSQDQIYQDGIVPLPASVWAGLGGLVLVAGVKRRFAKR